MKDLGLVLSGGGIRGVAHAGVLQALDEIGIKPFCISGTSSGAIVGAMYAAGIKPREMLELVGKSDWFKVIKPRLLGGGLMKHTYLRNLLKATIGDKRFEDLAIPLYVTATNLMSGKLEVFSSGPLLDVVVASSSVPLLFEPVEIKGEMYLDGGLIMNFPAQPLIDKCDVLVGVNLVPQVSLVKSELNSFFKIATRSFDLSVLNNINPQKALCQAVIEPTDLYKYNRFDFSFTKSVEIFDMAYRESMEKANDIKVLLQSN